MLKEEATILGFSKVAEVRCGGWMLSAYRLEWSKLSLD